MSYFSSPPAQVRLLGRKWPSFQLWLLAGLAAGPAAAIALAAARGLEPLAMLAIILLALFGFLFLAWLSSRRDGRERLFYYPAENAALLLAALFLLATGRPLWPYLDLLAIGLGGTYALVRLGCHHAGCCHGPIARPGARHSVRYGIEHVAEGFPAAYAGLPLFPLQALEGAIVAILTAAGVFFVAGSPLPPGSALGWWLGSYALARFFLDFLRTDPETPFAWSLTTAQWNALARSWLAAFLATFLGSYLAAPLFLGAAILTAAAAARLPFRGKAGAAALRSPRGRNLVAGALAAAEAPANLGRPPELRRLAGGLLFSCGCLEGGKITHVTLSRAAGPIAPATLAAFAEAVRASRPRLAMPRLFASGSGIVHLLYDHPES